MAPWWLEAGERCAFPLKNGNSERGGVKGEPAGHLGHRHFLRQVNFRTNYTEDLRIWNWFPLNYRCLHIPWKGFKIPPGVYPLGSEGHHTTCSKTQAWIDLKFKGRREWKESTGSRLRKNYPKSDSNLGCFIHTFFDKWESDIKIVT